jgi:hypothetical protein
MPLRIGLLVYPMFVMAIALGQRGPVGKFIRAGAVSPETARRPASLDIMYIDTVQAAVKRGILVRTGDGRYYVNLRVHHQRRRRIAIALAVVTGAFLVFALLAFMPLHG